MKYPHLSTLLFDQPWLITERALQSMIARVESETVPDLEALATKLGRPLENTGNRVELRGSTAILEVQGPIFRYANLFSMLSGATSVELLGRDFQAALDNPAVENILLRVDSPGGEINGIHDLAKLIHESRKPVTAFVDGLGASAAYWLASAAGKIYGSASAFTGSIGAVATVTDRRAAQERQGVRTYTIVSSQSPRKVVDPATEDGQKALQEMVDAAGELFVDRVAAYRGISTEKVLSDFGRGFVLPSRLAHKAGMIDGITTEEELIASLKSHYIPAAGVAAQEGTTMEQPTNPAPVATGTTTTPAPDAGVTERQRIQAILGLPEAQGRSQLAQTLAFEPGMTVESAQRILAAAPTAPPPTPANPLERQMSQVPNPKVGVAQESDDTAQAEAGRILAFVPARQKVNAS